MQGGQIDAVADKSQSRQGARVPAACRIGSSYNQCREHIARHVMGGEDVNGDFRAFEIDFVELDQLFLKRALGEDKAQSVTSPQR